MKRLAATLLAALSACAGGDPAAERCEDDESCPFQQCCVEGACVDPGPLGSCRSAAIANSSLVITPATVVAGVNAAIRITVRDSYGRSIAGAPAEVLIQSACGDCDIVTSASWITDERGIIDATFNSTGSGTKLLTLRVGSTLATPTLVQVVPDVAVSVGFATAIADTRVDSALTDVAVTRLDAYGNPDALPASGAGTPTTVEIQLDTNAAGLVLVGADRNPLPAASLRFVLSQPRVPVPGLYVNLVAHGLELTAFDASATPTLAASQSNSFDVTSPRVSSDMPAVLSGSPVKPVTLTWATDPAFPAAIHEGDANLLGASSPLAYTPIFSFETSDVTHVRIEPNMSSPARDVEVSRLGGLLGFNPSSRAGAQVNIHDLKRFANGDVVVVGNFSFDMALGGRKVTAVVQAGLEGFIARLDPTLTSLRWVVIFYAVDRLARGTSVAIRDVDFAPNTDLIALSEFNGGGAGWRFDGPADAAFPSGKPMQCTMGTPTTETPFTTAVARIDAATGVVEWCAGLHDPDAATGSVASVRAGAVASISNVHYIAARVTETFRVYRGTIVDGATPEVRVDTATTGDVPLAVPAPETGCAAGATTLVPLRGGLRDAAWNVATTAISFEPTLLFRDSDGQGFVLGGNACSNAVNPIEVGGSDTIDTGSLDGTLLRIDTPVAHGTTPGNTIHAVWQSAGPSNDRLFDVEPFAGDLLLLGDYAGTLTLGGESLGPVAGFTSVYVARLDRSAGDTIWQRRLGSTTSVTVPQGLTMSGDRLVLAAQAFDDLVLVGSPHKAIDMNDEQPDPVGLLLELDATFGAVRWSSPFLGTTRTSRPLALPGGAVLLGADGLQGSIVLGPLDERPLRQTNLRGGRLEPVLGLFSPFDYVVRDINRAP